MNRRRWLVRAGQVLLLAIVAWAVYHGIVLRLAELSREELARWRPAPLLLALSTLGLLAVYLSHAFFWRRIAADLGGGTARPRATVRVHFMASLGRYVPGKIWQVAGLAVLARSAGVAPLPAAAAALLAQVAFLATGGVFLALVLPAWAGPLPALAAGLLVATVAAGLYGVASTAAGLRFRGWLAGRAPRLTPAVELGGRVRGRDALAWGAGYAASWILLGASFTLFVVAFVPTTGELPRLAGSVAAAYLGGYLVFFLPAGIGAREVVMAELLAQVIPGPAAALIAVASRLWFTVAELLPLTALPLLRDAAEDAGIEHSAAKLS
jgi:glycosyltransferase 2 family protein